MPAVGVRSTQQLAISWPLVVSLSVRINEKCVSVFSVLMLVDYIIEIKDKFRLEDDLKFMW